MERVKWTDKIKNTVVLERVGEGRILLELIKKRKRALAGPLAKKELPAEGCSRRNGKVHRCEASGSMRACHAAGPGSIPGRDRFPG